MDGNEFMKKMMDERTREYTVRTLLDTTKNDEFLMKFFNDPEADFNDVTDGIVKTIQPKNDEMWDEIAEYISVIRKYDRFINLVDWKEKYEDMEQPDVDIDLYNHAFFGIRGYIEKNILPKIKQ